MRMSRAETGARLSNGTFDVVVIGAGITGARVALESARTGLRTALVDAGDVGGGTSSASSKLIHGGFRYLPMGDIELVRESQRERRVLMERVAPNLVRPLPFLLPVYEGSPRGSAAVAAGLVLYRALSGRAGHVSWLSRRAAGEVVPSLRLEGLRACGVFDEAETIDSRLVLATAKGAARHGALFLNHAEVIGLELRPSREGVVTLDAGDLGRLEVRARHVVNAAGPSVDRVRALDDPSASPLVRLSKGVHLMLPLEAGWKAGVAMPVAKGRVALGIPWQGTLMLGTTDTLYAGDPADVRVTEADVAAILDEASGFLPRELLRPGRVLYRTAGLRALPIDGGDTAVARRGHMIEVSRSGLVSVAGGKLTTHRLIACDALRRIPCPRVAGLSPDECRLPGTGWSASVRARPWLEPEIAGHLERLYGDEAGSVLDLAAQMPDGLERISPQGPDVWAQVAYAFESEWACTVDDVARRRTTVSVRGLMNVAIAARIGEIMVRFDQKAPSAAHNWGVLRKTPVVVQL